MENILLNFHKINLKSLNKGLFIKKLKFSLNK